MATRAVNKTAKEGEQNARLLLSRGALSAMAIFRRAAFPSVRRWRCTAPYPLLAPAAPALCLSCFWRGRSPSPAFGAVFFCGEGGSYLVRGESRRSSMARSSRMRSRATGSGNILARCVPGRSPMAKCSRNAFPSVRRRQDCALMRSWPDWQWQYSRAVRSRAAIRDNFFASCIPKAASDGKIASSWQDSHTMHPKTGWLWQDMRAMHPKSPANRLSGTHGAKILPGRAAFAARTPRIMHGAQILPSVAAPNRPSARDPGAAEQREPPELDRPAQETQPGRQRPRRLLGSKYRQQLPRYRHCSLPTPASSLSPGEQLCHCRQHLL